MSSPAWGTDRPLAVKGLTSYRYRGRFGWIMIGAKDTAEALREAERSHGEPCTVDRLEIWTSAGYAAAGQP